jgi:hypothetical protein
MHLYLRPRRGRPGARVQSIVIVPQPRAFNTEVIFGVSDGRVVALDLAGADIGVIYALQAAIIDARRNDEAARMVRAK